LAKGLLVGLVFLSLVAVESTIAMADIRSGSALDPADGTHGPSEDIERLSAFYDEAGEIVATLRFRAPIADVTVPDSPSIDIFFRSDPSGACQSTPEYGFLGAFTTPSSDFSVAGGGHPYGSYLAHSKTVSPDRREITLTASGTHWQGLDYRCVYADIFPANNTPGPLADEARMYFDGYPPSAPGGGGGGGGGGLVGGGATDTSPPIERVALKRKQDVDRLVLFVRSNEDAIVTVRATVSVPAAAARTVRFKAVRKAVTAGKRKKIRLRLSRRRKKLVKRALHSGRKLKAKITVTAKDAAGNTTVKKRRVRLKD
jgi:hypothetical protein